MGSGGTEWEVGDKGTEARMNQKTLFVGTGAEIAALSPTYAGQKAFCIMSGNGFQIGKRYFRNDDDLEWIREPDIGEPYDTAIKLSTTFGDYAAPVAAVASSEAGTIPAYSDDFTGVDNWVDADSAKIGVNTTTDMIDFTFIGDGSNDTSYYDLGGVVSDIKWVLRLKIRWTTAFFSDGAGGTLHYIGLGDNTSARTTAQDFLGFRGSYAASGVNLQCIDSDGAAVGTSGDASHSPAMSASTWYYLEIKRLTSTTYSARLYSDDTFSTPVSNLLSGTCNSTLQNLRYIKIMNVNGSFSNQCSGNIDWVKFYDDTDTVDDKTAGNAIDGNLATFWKSQSEANPRIYFDYSSNRDIVALMLAIKRTETTIAEIKIRASTDTTFDDAENVRFVEIADFTDATRRYILINRLPEDRRYIQVYGVGTGVLAICDTRARYGLTEAQISRHRYTYMLSKNLVETGVDSN